MDSVSIAPIVGYVERISDLRAFSSSCKLPANNFASAFYILHAVLKTEIFSADRCPIKNRNKCRPWRESIAFGSYQLLDRHDAQSINLL